MRLSSLLAVLRPALPLILGLSLGCSLSLLRVSWIQGEGEHPCVEAVREPGGLQNPDSRTRLDQSDEDFKPRIVPYYRDPNKPYKKVLRTRYIQTELGSRERLLVAVLTSRATLSTLAVAVNRTVAHHFPRLLYFTGQRGARTPAGMQVVSHGDERPAWLMSETLRHLHTHFGGDYDWFFIMQDDTYVQAPRLAALAGHLSINQDLYLGRAEEFIGAGEQARYCHGGFGYLLSRSLLLRLRPHLDGCRGDILSARPDEWLGRCLIDSLGIGCVSQHQGQQYRSFELAKNRDPEKEGSAAFLSAFAVHPVSEGTLMYRLHKRFSALELERAYSEIEQLQAQIRNLTELTPEGAAGLGLLHRAAHLLLCRWGPQVPAAGGQPGGRGRRRGDGSGAAEPALPAPPALPEAAAPQRLSALRPGAGHGVHPGPAAGGRDAARAPAGAGAQGQPAAAAESGGDPAHALRHRGHPRAAGAAAPGGRSRRGPRLPRGLCRGRPGAARARAAHPAAGLRAAGRRPGGPGPVSGGEGCGSRVRTTVPRDEAGLARRARRGPFPGAAHGRGLKEAPGGHAVLPDHRVDPARARSPEPLPHERHLRLAGLLPGPLPGVQPHPGTTEVSPGARGGRPRPPVPSRRRPFPGDSRGRQV
uniref:Hexosyltransferase n=1 Tax=Rousettus aegyptiacus TaxID=9407 RepID=A0A7J8D574_ROUAE|nr:chondroitin polymerizing factor 2 [Rousettus aegyptiacus]